jgi:hypothetical protein
VTEHENLKRFNLPEAFLMKQAQLETDLHAGALIADHSTTKGDDTELNWLGMLRDLLPERYGVARAHVIDAQCRQSPQLDIVIHDRFFSPLLFEHGNARFIPAESVYAVFEVKQELNRGYLVETADKVSAVRSLHRTSVPIPSAMGKLQSKDLDQFWILGGILSSHSGWNPPFGEPFRQCLRENVGRRGVDIGTALDNGAFEAVYTSHSEEGELQDVHIGKQQGALIFFVTRLLHRLQQMASVPAIDYGLYGNAIPGAPNSGESEAND